MTGSVLDSHEHLHLFCLIMCIYDCYRGVQLINDYSCVLLNVVVLYIVVVLFMCVRVATI